MDNFTEQSGAVSPVNESKKKKILIISLSAVSFLVAVTFIWYFVFYRVTPVTDSFTYEFGSVVSRNIRDYVSGRFGSEDYSVLDLSKVDESRCGVYYGVVKHFPETFTFEIRIKDTTSPAISLRGGKNAFEAGKTYGTDSFVANVSDLDDNVNLRFLNLSGDSSITTPDNGKEIMFSEVGKKDITIMAIDSSGNSSHVISSVIVDTAPVIYTYDTYYTALGTDVDFDAYAEDDMDGDVSDSIRTDSPVNYSSKVGHHRIRLYATDSNGLTGERYTDVFVGEPEVIQDMVNLGEIDPFADNVFGVINPYDCGYTVEDDIEHAREAVIPAVVRVSYETSRIRSYGSGYILKIDDEGVIIGTNQHVVSSMSKVNVSFFNGESYTGRVINRKRTPDMAFVRVSRDDIPVSLLNDLRTVHINLNYFESLSYKPSFSVGMYCTDGNGGEWLTRYGYIVRKSGTLSEYFPDYAYPVTEVSVDLTPGVSGSMVFDSHGNFVCMASFYWANGGLKENYGVSLDDILDFYEETFGERLEYY